MSKRLKKRTARDGAVGGLRGKRKSAVLESVVQLGLVRDPGLRWGLAGRRLPEEVAPRRLPPLVEQQVAGEVAAWHEAVGQAEFNHGKPIGIQKTFVCGKGHVLGWLASSPWGVVPIAQTSAGAFVSRINDDGTPMSLSQWPAGEHLPIASCACHEAAEISVHQARSWDESGRDKAVYKP